MTTPKFIAFALVTICLTSCGKTRRLSDKDFQWMPYKGSETLVFASNTGENDTVFLLKKDTLIAHPEAQSLNGSEYEVVSIFCKHSDPAPPDGDHRYLENSFAQIGKSKDGNAK